MFTLKSTILLGAPLLAAATSEILPSRIQRRHALLELLQHNHEKRDENYGTVDICSPDAGDNDASFTPLTAGSTFASALYTYEYSNADQSCLTSNNCQSACIADADNCVGIVYGSVTPSCTLYGPNFGGDAVFTVPSGFQILQNAGTPSNSVATCASKASAPAELDTLNSDNGACSCGAGRMISGSAFTCEAIPVPDGVYSPNKQPKTIEEPVYFTAPITWDYGVQAVPAVLTTDQCAAICIADSKCEAFILKPGSELSTCWKLGPSGAYDSPADGFSFTQRAARMVRRAAGQTGEAGESGDVFGELVDSTLTNNAYNAPSGGTTRRRVKRAAHQAQW